MVPRWMKSMEKYDLNAKSIPYVLLLGTLFGTTLVGSRFSVGQFDPSTMGNVEPIPCEDIKRLKEKRRKLGFTEPECLSQKVNADKLQFSDSALKSIIKEELKKLV